MEIIRKENLTIYLNQGKGKDSLLLFHLSDQKEAQCFLKDFSDENLILITGNNWEKDFTPYPHQKVFHGGKDFEGKADIYQKELLDELLPALEEQLQIQPKRRIIGGYSLAGLFAFMTGYQSPLFTSVCCGSPSLWYPGYLEHLKSLPIPTHLQQVYLSIGNKESETKNPYLSKAMKAMEDTEQFLKENQIKTHFVIEEGGHFTDTYSRLKKGAVYLLSD